MNKWIWIAGGIIISAAFLAWLFIESTKPLPGQKQALECDNLADFSKLGGEDISDKCRAHVPAGTGVNYLTNPPTMGPHYADWVRAGVYSEPKDDRNMVHSLEHGYVILSFKCKVQSAKLGEATGSGEASGSGRMDTQAECDVRKTQLEGIFNKKGKKKLIVVPRPNLDTNFALTAWQYIDKFDPSAGSGLSVSDMGRIEKFIDTHRDNGPEKTME
ncbi:MAG: hypothetical protein CEO21_269 [Microgenomates group bacterium Gr01-1014_80]|nr:MAG: hypothetical protein CEO21_269 [Microgenomates group bacterium Gr01-1014_80]